MVDNTYSIVMFAYNEEKSIQQAVLSVFKNVDKRLGSLSVIANGCSDSTVSLLKELKKIKKYAKLRIIELDIGDKCNAWNEYVHNLHTNSEVHFFTDADIQFTDMAFPKMFDTLMADNTAHAIAGVPFSGRNKKQYLEMVTKYGCLFGNCYAVKKSFIDLVKEKDFYLPIGLCWIDSAITKVLKRDIQDQSEPMPNRIIFNLDCGYHFDSLSPFKIDDINLYFSRIARYKVGQLQEKHLEKLPFSKWPRDLTLINQKIIKQINEKEICLDFYLKKTVLKRLNKSLPNFDHEVLIN